MRILYIFPHPDDESFGPAASMYLQLKAGHEVFLYTLTKGGATKVRHELGLSIEAMGEVRYQEMVAVENVLGLTGMRVDDFPDGQLAYMDPRVLEQAIQAHIEALQPQVVVTYPVYGISGFHDHLVAHAVIKRVYLELRDRQVPYLKRLAFLALPDNGESPFMGNNFRIKQSPPGHIDCSMPLSDEARNAMREALNCYKTYQKTIAESQVVEKVGDTNHFEFFGESFDPPVTCMTHGLTDPA
ncbi:N-acetylglucosaminyl deacetylase, LmbE family [Catalinimonas alkaloidigena]|uniref:N-acetylglucosaminyl deacetylase, LmbE family n=1 Tax=Catalinimonas alkaloidigena TaxID=1075417 RepID=A0A1G8X8Y4_9BACT|nr:PIG-L family deacetylase [Catalinimonas alkaloidigena]SDJ86325.1 N-acetylglucosaminyl deacetylase, LmbE family [Catalinimonas alkaloidigena]